MAKTLDQLKREKQVLLEQAEAQQSIYENDKRRTPALKESLALQKKILEVEDKIYKQSVTGEADILSLDKQIKNIKDATIGVMQKRLGIDKQIQVLEKLKTHGTEEQIKNATKFNDVLLKVADGSMDLEALLRKMATEDFGDMNKSAGELADMMRNNPGFTEQAKGASDFTKGLDDIKDKLGMIDLKKTFSVAGIMAAIVSFAGKILEVKQSLGTSAVESARLAGNMTAAGLAAKAVGGSSVEAENAVKGLVDEFGSLSVVSAGVSAKLGLMTGQFGISGANAAKLLKSMEAINGASIETNMNLISATGELARAEGVAPAKVLNDIAENTKTFAEFAKDGGDNIAKAAIHAAKLGLNLSNVAQIADKLLNFEQSIQDEMQAEMLIGKQLNLDKARQLALEGDLEGLMGEVTDNLVSQAEWSEMNVIQRRALADAIGVSAADMGKMVAGEKTSAQLAEDRVAQENKMLDVQKAIASVQIATAIAQLFAGNAKLGPTGIAIALGGIGALYAAISAAPKLETGGVVKETGMAQVHRGEVFSGTKNEMGFGNETNKLLADTKEQNNQVISELKLARINHTALMGTLKSAIDRIPMA
jgi:hypothetical protein